MDENGIFNELSAKIGIMGAILIVCLVVGIRYLVRRVENYERLAVERETTAMKLANERELVALSREKDCLDRHEETHIYIRQTLTPLVVEATTVIKAVKEKVEL